MKALKKTLPAPVSKKIEETPEPEFKMSALYGEALLNMAQTASQYERRDCFSKIQDFLKTRLPIKFVLFLVSAELERQHS